MFQLVEAIRIEDKKLHHIALHNQRFNLARTKLFGLHDAIDLRNHIQIPDNITTNRYKCRISTTDGIHIQVGITLYEQRKIESLKLVPVEKIDYAIKSNQRQALDLAFEQRGNCDDIIIVQNECLTDSWAANVILTDGFKWYTPNTPLLKGIQREYLISIGEIVERRISVKDLSFFNGVKLINAMIDFERAPFIKIENIIH